MKHATLALCALLLAGCLASPPAPAPEPDPVQPPPPAERHVSWADAVSLSDGGGIIHLPLPRVDCTLSIVAVADGGPAWVQRAVWVNVTGVETTMASWNLSGTSLRTEPVLVVDDSVELPRFDRYIIRVEAEPQDASLSLLLNATYLE